MARWRRLACFILASALTATACGTQPQAAPGPQAPGPQASGAAASGAPPSTAPAVTPKRGGTLVAALGAEPGTGNMSVTSDASGFYAFTPVYSSLVEVKPNDQIGPDLAKSWTVSPDGKRYEFTLNPAKFHDGTPLTSADVKYTIDEVAGKYSPRFSPTYKNVERVEAPNDTTVVFVLKSPSAVFLKSLAHSAVTILSKKIYAGSDPRNNPQNSKPIGSGPFKFKEWVKGDHITLERNPDYFMAGLPHLDQVILRIIPDAGARAIAFQKGDVDINFGQNVARQQVAELAKLPGVQLNDKDGPPGHELVLFNLTRKPFDDPKVRQAFVYAIDRASIVERAYFNAAKVPTSHLPQQLTPYWDSSIQLPARDIKKAETLLDEAGYKKDASGNRLSVKFDYNPGNNSTKLAAEIVRDNLRDIGVRVEIIPTDLSVSAKKVVADADFDMYTGPVTTNGDPDGPSRFYLTSSIKVANASRYSNPEIDRLFAEGASATDPKARQAAYKKVQEVLARDLPSLPLADYVNIDFARPEIGGVSSEPIGFPFFYVQRFWRK